MKIQVANDLHLELLPSYLGRNNLIQPAPAAELLVLAGDVHRGIRAIEAFADWPVPVVLVAGNHEFYREVWEQTRLELRYASQGTNVHFLDNDSYELLGVRFLGCTLWTDYCLGGVNQTQAMAEAEDRLNDHRSIETRAGRFTAAKALEDHQVSRTWLRQVLNRPFDGPTVVVTHHGPHPLSVHPRYAEDPLNPSFSSDLGELLLTPDLWLHGHTHDSFDYKVGNCRVVANPAGYVLGRKPTHGVLGIPLENEAFSPSLVIEVKQGGRGCHQV